VRPHDRAPSSLRGKGARGISLAAGLSLFVVLSPSSALADLTRCHSALQSEIARLDSDIRRAIESCAAAIRRARDGGDHLSRAADQCDRSLMKVYNAAQAPGRSSLERFRDNIERLHPRKCSDADLLAMGYFVPGINAPGRRGPCLESGKPCARDGECTGTNDFCPGAMGDVIRRLATQVDDGARRAQLQILPDLAELIAAALDLRPGASNEFGTDDCSRPPAAGPLTPNHRQRPNLCMLKTLFPCVARQCTLSLDSKVVLSPLGIPISLASRTVPLEVCTPSDATSVGHCVCSGGAAGGCVAGRACADDFDCGTTATAAAGTCSPDVLYLSVGSQGMLPPSVIPLAPPITTCVEMLAFQGWCDCGTGSGGQGAPFMPQLCADHVIDGAGKDDCGPSAAILAAEDDCACASINGVTQSPPQPPCTTPGCDSCVHSDGSARCHSGTRNSPPHEAWSGASAANDCAFKGTLRLSFLPPAFCRDGGGAVRGVCGAPGPPDAGCTALGGVKCVDPRGANKTACDGDDDTPWTLFPVRAAMTTGTSAARVADWVMSEGVCTASGNLNCIEDRNCPAPATCAGATFGCGSGPALNDCQVGVGPGGGISCSDLRAGSLAGWKLVGSVPRLDQPALGDALVQLTLECE
jgi:hypothetical protein